MNCACECFGALQPCSGALRAAPCSRPSMSPGTQALARQSGACFINVRASTLQSKWFGDTQKLVQAAFTLAYKIQPCIIFIGVHPSCILRAAVFAPTACLLRQHACTATQAAFS